MESQDAFVCRLFFVDLYQGKRAAGWGGVGLEQRLWARAFEQVFGS